MSAWLPEDLVAEHGRFRVAAMVWRRLGVNTIPLRGKTPLVKFSYQDEPGYKPTYQQYTAPPREGWHMANSPLIDDETFDAWCELYPNANVGLLLGRTGVVAFDLDDARDRNAVLRHLGSTPLETVTRQGCHLFYRGHGEDLGMGGRTYQAPGAVKATIDHRQSGGFVVAPGSMHKTGVEYTSTFTFEDLWKRGDDSCPNRLALILPMLDPTAERQMRSDANVERKKKRSGKRKGAPHGTEFEVVGTIGSDTKVRGEDGKTWTLGTIPAGLGMYAWDREDETPSIRVSVDNGERWVFDWGARRQCWKVVDPRAIWSPEQIRQTLDRVKAPAATSETPERGPRAGAKGGPLAGGYIYPYASGRSSRTAQPDDGARNLWLDLDTSKIPAVADHDWSQAAQSLLDDVPHYAQALAAVAEQLGLSHECIELEPGYIGPQLQALRSNETVFLVTPHGSGKTTWLRGEVEVCKQTQQPAVAVQPTQLLTEVNAAKLGLTSQYASKEAVDENESLSVCINTLPRVNVSLNGLFIADEFEQSDAYIHSKKVEQPIAAYDAMRKLIACADRSVVSSASIPFELLVLTLIQIARLNPTRHVRIVLQAPQERKLTIHREKLSSTHAKLSEAFERLDNDPEYKFAVISTSRKEPRVLARLAQSSGHATEFISGEVSRLRETREKLQDPNALIRNNRVLVINPSIGSGVSFDEEIDDVFVLDTNPDMPVELLGQMVRRFRNVKNAHVSWGCKKWKPRSIRFDDDYLDTVACGRAEISDEYTRLRLPEVDYDPRKLRNNYRDAEFAQSWRIHERLLRQSKADPLGMRWQMWVSYGWEVTDTLAEEQTVEEETATARFRAQRDQAADEVKAERIEEVRTARDIDDEEADELRKAHQHERGDGEALSKHDIRKFYGLEDVTARDVEIDNEGKYRRACKNFARARIHGEGCDGKDDFRLRALAFDDFRKNRSSHRVHAKCEAFKAQAAHEIIMAVLGKSFGELAEGRGITLDAEVIRERMLEYLEDQSGFLISEYMGIDTRRSRDDNAYILRAFNAFTRRYGAEVSSVKSGDTRRYTYYFGTVCERSSTEYKRVLDRFKKREQDLPLMGTVMTLKQRISFLREKKQAA